MKFTVIFALVLAVSLSTIGANPSFAGCGWTALKTLSDVEIGTITRVKLHPVNWESVETDADGNTYRYTQATIIGRFHSDDQEIELTPTFKAGDSMAAWFGWLVTSTKQEEITQSFSFYVRENQVFAQALDEKRENSIFIPVGTLDKSDHLILNDGLSFGGIRKIEHEPAPRSLEERLKNVGQCFFLPHTFTTYGTLRGSQFDDAVRGK